jgi:large subunit GTPase 1
MIGKFLSDQNVKNPEYRPLKIPRRPEWSKDMSAIEIREQENQAFLEWRGEIAKIEENNIKLAITPFEKNIEVWKQLWRVIERSDLLLQIVDARNPVFFYSEDLDKYINEVGQEKEFILCINKADYLSQELIKHWNAYFLEKGVTHIFISAKNEQEKLDMEEEDYDDEEGEDEQSEEEEQKTFEPLFADLKKQIDIENELKERDQAQLAKDLGKEKGEEDIRFNTPEVFTRAKFLHILKQKAVSKGRNPNSRLMVGTVGYPNVGKSSLINVLCGRKRVGVAAMPGKTKHFQTLNLEGEGRDICLVDCPGLVFPSFANSTAEMYCCGVLPIQNIRNYLQPIQLILTRVPKEVMEHHYKIKLPPRTSKNYTATTFLSVYALKKGWVTGSSNPDIAVAAKQVLKDYTTGQIVFCNLRPDYDEQKHGPVLQAGFDMDLETVEEEETKQEDSSLQPTQQDTT